MRDAVRYRELAEYARMAGFDKVNGPAVKGWVQAGLLPRGEWVPWGFGKRSVAYPAATGAQVLALCRLRFRERIRRLPLLGLALWLEGWPVAMTTVRSGLALMAESPHRFVDMSRAPDADAWNVANIAVFERGFGSDVVARGIRISDLAQGMGDLVAMLAGDQAPEDADAAGLSAVGALVGLDRASEDDVTGDGPWLPMSPAEALRDASRAISTPRLLNVLAEAADPELVWARTAAIFLTGAFAATAERFAAAGDPNVAGIGLLAAGLRGPLGSSLVVLAVLRLPRETRAFFDALGEPELGRSVVSTEHPQTVIKGAIIRMT
jgi:hypothetical protein